MSAPLTRILFDVNTPASRRIREIENHYHLETIAEDSRQVAQFHAASLRLQAEHARILAQQNEVTNTLLHDISCDLVAMQQGIDYLNQGIDALNETAFETLGAIHTLTDTVRICFEHLAEQMMMQQRTLEDIAEILRRPYGTKVLELRKEADKLSVISSRSAHAPRTPSCSQ